MKNTKRDREDNSLPSELGPEDEECKRRLSKPLDEKQMRLFRMQLHLRLVPLFILPPAICAGIIESVMNGQANMPKEALGILVAVVVSAVLAVLFSIATAGLLAKIESEKSAELNWGNVCFGIFSLNSVSFTGYFVLLWTILHLAGVKPGNVLLASGSFVLMTVSTVSGTYLLRERFRTLNKRK